MYIVYTGSCYIREKINILSKKNAFKPTYTCQNLTVTVIKHPIQSEGLNGFDYRE